MTSAQRQYMLHWKEHGILHNESEPSLHFYQGMKYEHCVKGEHDKGKLVCPDRLLQELLTVRLLDTGSTQKPCPRLVPINITSAECNGNMYYGEKPPPPKHSHTLYHNTFSSALTLTTKAAK